MRSQRQTSWAEEYPEQLHPRSVRKPGKPGCPATQPPAPRSGSSPVTDKVDIFVAGVGTGGTVTGTGKYLKDQDPNVKVVAVEPDTSPVLSTGKGGPHKIQGIGAGFVPDVLDTKVYDEVIRVANAGSLDPETSRQFAHSEGLFVGISSGAALWAAVELSRASGERRQGYRSSAA